jgi:type III restriction enzyme
MALHPAFPTSPYEIINPEYRWFPADEDLRESSYDKLVPPLVNNIRREVKEWRDRHYEGVSNTSKALLNWWFNRQHITDNLTEFQYYFAQREAVETVIYLYEVAKVKDKYDLMRYDSSGAVSTGMFDEDWLRLVIKMATGSGKTKVMSLFITWCFFHKLYEEESQLATNFLLIAPNIIVLDRLRTDFDGLKIFFKDPLLPDNGYEGQNWLDDFQMTLHIQDDVSIVRKTGNLFLTNIHRVYTGSDTEPSFDDDNLEDYFLGKRPTGKTNESKVDLGVIVREIDELVIINDEAHHIHDSRLAWFKSIQDIHNRLKQKDRFLSIQLDVTATPKHNNGAIFVQTVSDYPLVEGIVQNVVKHPVLPDFASRAKLAERKSSKFTERYADYIHLGVEEWRKVYTEHEKLGKKAVLFVMTDDTKNCDDVAEYLESTYSEFKNAVLVIHTNNNGEISESDAKKSKEELEKLRKQSNQIDTWDSPYKVIVSVLMLKEGWDVRNVTTIVGLRAYGSKSKILPEQTLGRGLRRMYLGADTTEYVSVVGTEAFMDFVESIKSEGIQLLRKPMGEGTAAHTPLIIEVDNENVNKDVDALDLEIPVLTPRIYREYKRLEDLDIAAFGNKKIEYKQFSEAQLREIIFKDITTGDINHSTYLDSAAVTDYQSVIGYFTQVIMKDLRLFSGYDILYGKVKEFIYQHLFSSPVEIDDLNTIRNLSELEVTKTIIETFKKRINELTVQDKGSAEIRDYIDLKQTRPFVVKEQGFLMAQKSVFNKIVGDSHLELMFASFLDSCPDVISYAKNYFAVNFRIDYVNADGDISNYYPDFIVKTSPREIYIVETKGQEDLDVPLKMERLKRWCEDVNAAQNKYYFGYVFVEQEDFERYQLSSFENLVKSFRKYKDSKDINFTYYSEDIVTFHTFTLDTNLDEITETYFIEFKKALSKALVVHPEDIVILGLRPGSTGVLLAIKNFAASIPVNIHELLPDFPIIGFLSWSKDKALPVKTFISYSSMDRKMIQGIYFFLKTEQLEPWMDVHELMGGDVWNYEIFKALHSSTGFVFCLSNNSTEGLKKKETLYEELQTALEKERQLGPSSSYLIPVRIDNCEYIPDIKKYQVLNWDADQLELALSLRKGLEKRKQESSRIITH